MSDPFSVAGSAVGVISLGISVCQGLVNYYSAFKGQDDEVNEMVGKVEMLTDLLETLQHRLSSPRYRHSISVEKVEQNIIACASALKKLHEVLSKCMQHSMDEDLQHTLRAISRKLLYPFKHKTLQDLSAAVFQCQIDLTTAMQILQIDQLSTVESSNAVIVQNTAATRDIIQVNSHEVSAMREDIERFMKVAVPALVLSSMRPQFQGNAKAPTATVLDMSSTNLKPKASEERTIRSPKSHPSLCNCHARTKFIERQLRLGPITLIRTSKSRVEHNEDCQYFVPRGQEEGAGLRFQVGTRSRRWNITAILNYNHAVGAFSINPTVSFKATVPKGHPLFLVAKDIVRGKRSFEAGLQSIRLLFQNGQTAPDDVRYDGVNVMMEKVALGDVWDVMEERSTIDGAFQERVERLIMAFLAWGVNVNEIVNGGHVLDLYRYMLLQSSHRSDAFSFLNHLREKTAMHRDCFYEPKSWNVLFGADTCTCEESRAMIEAVKKDEYLGKEWGFNNLCLAVSRKSLGAVESILSESPSAISSCTAFKHTVLHLAADWPIGMATLLPRGGRSLIHMLDSANESPLDYACHYNCASVVKLLLQAGSGFDQSLMRCVEDQSYWEIFQIFIEEISRRRDFLRQFAEIELSGDTYRDLEIPVGHPMSDIKTVLVLSELEKSSIQIPETLTYYGITEFPACLPVNLFAASFGTTSKGADIMHNAGFLLDIHVDIPQEHCLRGQIGRFCKYHLFWDLSLTQHLDTMLCLQEKGLVSPKDHVHYMFYPSSRRLWLEDEPGDLMYSPEDRMNLLSQLLSSRSGRQHACPCSVDVCFTALAALRNANICRPINDPEGANRIFADLLSLLAACKSDFGSQFWAWAMPRLIHSVLYEACRLTHSLDCCKRGSKARDEDEVREKQEEEGYMRSRLSTLTEELTTEYQESSISLADFLRDRVVVRALELVKGEEDASIADRQRLREMGVVLKEESDSD